MIVGPRVVVGLIIRTGQSRYDDLVLLSLTLYNSTNLRKALVDLFDLRIILRESEPHRKKLDFNTETYTEITTSRTPTTTHDTRDKMLFLVFLIASLAGSQAAPINPVFVRP